MSVDNAGGSHASGAGEEKFDLNELIAGLKANESAKERYEVLGVFDFGFCFVFSFPNDELHLQH
jgi:alpha/beta superfamily hydrolase